ncbi:GFA family protein [Halioxenophilus sp. WMMB6]|uniref:GFA family protein n=1 Tax=Halioxenophilus sp. WMMB6 TaxID=3073815 RepID=UPI00398C0EFE
MGVVADQYQQIGVTRIYQDVGDSGQPVERHFCSQCGSPILSKITALPEMVFIKAGTLNHTDTLSPEIEVYCSSAMDFVPHLPNTQRFDKSNI